MRSATANAKKLVIDILTNSFLTNQSVNYIVKQDGKKIQRIRALMDYSFEICISYGKVLISDDGLACALILFPEQKGTNLNTISLDIKLIFDTIGIQNIAKAIRRESAIKKLQPKENLYYLWFIGVKPQYQGRGIGSKLLKEILEDSVKINRPLYLETSTVRNLPWYQQMGFEIYNELDLGYRLYFLKRGLA